MKINIDFKLDINRIVKYFILSDLTFLAGWGLLDPLFAVFITRNISGATMITVGIMAAIYWGVKSIFQIPISMFLDKFDGEKDDFYALIVGILLASLTMFSFMAASEVWHLYVIQFFKAIAFALYVPAWTAILSRHLDRDKVAFEWALASTSAGFAIGLTGLIGSWLAEMSFNLMFLVGGSLGLGSAIFLILAPNLILPPRKMKVSESVIRDHGPANIQK
ncbi:MAG: preprotein translocase subunit SecE [Minisyncoccota bacterium]